MSTITHTHTEGEDLILQINMTFEVTRGEMIVVLLD